MRITSNRSKVLRLLTLIAALFGWTGLAFTAANLVYHEQTGVDVTGGAPNTCGGAQAYVPILNPASAQAYLLRFTVQNHLDTDTLKVYYTTDGSTPSGSFGVPAGTTQVIGGSYQCTFTSGANQVDVCNATIPAQPPGTVVKYIIGAYHSPQPGGGDEIFASGTFNNSSLATVFQYTVLPQYSLTVGVAGTGGGRVTSSSGGIDCGTACSATYDSGTLVTLSAASDSTSTFVGWSGACSGVGDCTVTMDAAKSVIATFDRVTNILNGNLTLTVVSESFDSTPSPGFVGNYTINATLANSGPPISAPIFFRIVELSKNGADLDVLHPDQLLSADNGAGLAGDIQTLPISQLAAGASTPVSFLVGIGSQQTFDFYVDLLGKLPPATTPVGGPPLAGTFGCGALDTLPPVITCPGNITTNTAPGQCGTVVNFDATATDDCPGVTVACVPASGSSFSTGTNMVTCTATDAAGNTASCSFNVVVNDTEGPVITCPANITTNTPPGQCSAVVSFAATATDNCPGVTVACVPASGSTFAKGTNAVTCTATDAAGNTAGCNFSIVVNDTENPVVTCPGDITAITDPGQCSAVVNFATTATDNCPGVTLACVPASGSSFANGTNTVTCTATDAVGNTASCSFNIVVVDLEGPVVSCPGNITASTAAGQCSAVVNFAASATDNCPGVTVACVPASGSSFTKGTTTVTCTATDAVGDTSSCSFNVVVNDTESPSIACPANILTNTAPGQCSAVVNFAPTATDNCPGVTVACVPASGSTFAKGTNTVTCTATDGAGNTAGCSFNVTVNDLENPVITCPANLVTNSAPGQCSAMVNFAAPAATDNCPGVTVACVPASGSTFSKGTNTVTCTATDVVGNTASCNFKVTVNDGENPVITCPANLVTNTTPGQCSAVVNFAAPTATDNCPGVTVACIPASGSTFAKGTNTVACTATDAAGNSTSCNFQVTVNDVENPVITCPANITTNTALGQCSAVATFAVPAATDNCPGVTVACIPASGSTFVKGTNTVTCTATDASGNSASCNFKVTVNDLENPLITCPANITTNTAPGQCSAVVNFAAPAATDNCPGVTVACVPTSGSTFSKGTNTVTCAATDASGNSATCSFKVTVNDIEAPTLACPANITTNTALGQCSAVVSFAATASDNCPGVTVACVPTSGSTFSKGTNTVTCTATDASGNIASCSFKVTVIDAEIPILTCPANITTNTASGQCSAVVNFALPAATDNCPGVAVVCVPASGSTFSKGTNLVTCTATDAAGNSASCNFRVTVNDAENPVITCPANLVTNTAPGQCSAVVNFATPPATDNCPGVNVVCIPSSGSTFPKGITTIACRATDASGNSAICNFRVFLNDTEKPVINCPASIVTNAPPGQCSAAVSFTATATDNCPGVALTCAPPSGSSFGTGTNTVTCTATDASGNTANCSFKVTVLDTQNPVITCPANIVTNTGPGQCTVVVNFTTLATDNCPGTTVVCAPPSGSAFPPGTNAVNCTATDAAGNTASCAFSVTVIGPAITIAAQPQSVTNQAGTTATLSVAASGVSPLSFQWRQNGTNLPPETHSQLILPNVQPASAGNYTVVVTDPCGGSVTSLVAALSVNRPPVAGLDGFGTLKNTSKNISLASLLSNDSDPDGDPLGVTGFDSASFQGGTIALAGPLLTYTPPVDFVGGDHFTYTISDGRGGSATGDVCVSVAAVSLVYSEPNLGWTYAYDGSWTTVTNGTNIGGYKALSALDGQWSSANNSSEWAGDARGPGNGPGGGISSTNGILTIEDLNLGSGIANNRKIYFTRDFANDAATTSAGTLADNGVTISFRARLTQPDIQPPPEGGVSTVPDGWGMFGDGKGNFNVSQSSPPSTIGFSLVRASEPDNGFNFPAAGLTMNRLNGNAPAGGGAVNSSATASDNQVFAVDPNVFHEFWITIQTNRFLGSNGTHTVDIYADGSLAPATFNVTAGTGNEGNAFNATNYLGMGLGNSAGRGVIDIDFFAYKQGVIPPSGFGAPVKFVQPLASRTVLQGQTARFDALVSGTAPYFFQWQTNGVTVPGATNQSFSFPTACADKDKILTVAVSNLFSSAASGPALLTVIPNSPPPVLSISQQGTNLVICWPLSCAVFQLQEASSLAFPINWQPATAPVTANGTNYCVTESALTSRFYRLKQQ